MAHTTVDNNVIAALCLDAHNRIPPPSRLLVAGQWYCTISSQMKGWTPTSEYAFLRLSNRPSVISPSSSFVSLADSKYPKGTVSSIHGLIPYAYDPSGNENEPVDEKDLLHDPRAYAEHKQEVRPSQRVVRRYLQAKPMAIHSPGAVSPTFRYLRG